MKEKYQIVGPIISLFSYRKGRLLLLFFLTLLTGLGSGFSIVLLIPLLQLITDGSIEQNNKITSFINEIFKNCGLTPNLESILVLFVVLISSLALLQYGKSMLQSNFNQRFIYMLRHQIFEKIINADWELLNNRSKSDYVQVLSTEVPKLTKFYFFTLRMFSGVIITASYLVWASLISFRFTIIISIAGITIFILLRTFLFKTLKLGKGYVDSYNRLLKYIDDFWMTVKIAKVHNSEHFYLNRFEKVAKGLFDLEYKLERNNSLPKLIYQIAGILLLVFFIYITNRNNWLSFPSFFVLIILFSRIFPKFSAINTDINMIMSNLASVNLVMKINKDLPDPLRSKFQGGSGINLEKEIKVEKINFSYPENKILFKDFNAIIPAFQLTGIIGPSGKGKTSLLDIIAGLQKPQSGQVKVDGHILDETNLPIWKKSIGYLPQDSFFIDGSLRENLLWDSPETPSDIEILKILRQINAWSIIQRFPAGLDEKIVNYSFKFSGGERQRLALARVLLRKPHLLLLDEATSSLDEENEELIMGLLTELKKEITIIVVTHKSSVLPWLDKIIRM